MRSPSLTRRRILIGTGFAGAGLFLTAALVPARRAEGASNTEGVNILSFGASTGSRDNTAAMNAALATGDDVFVPNGSFKWSGALNYTKDGQTLYGLGANSKLMAGAASAMICNNGFDRCTLRHCHVEGAGTATGLRIENGASDFKVESVYFRGGNQRIRLFACSRIVITNCDFDGTGYGVIQEAGYQSDDVQVIGNRARAVTADFVEANCTSAAPSANWLITNNLFAGSANFPEDSVEQRFVGITAVKNVTVANNIVRNCAGDAAVHLEDALGQTIIAHNHFENCVGSFAYLYLLNSAEDTLIEGNYFSHTDAKLTAEYVLNLGSGNYGNSITFNNNRLIGNASRTLNGIAYAFQGGQLTCVGNHFEQLGEAISCVAGDNAIVSSNTFDRCGYAVKSDDGPTSGSNDNWVVSGNRITGAVSDGIVIRRNSSGTNPSTNWVVNSNISDGSIRIFDGVDCHAFGNKMLRSAICNVSATQYGGGSSNTNGQPL